MSSLENATVAVAGYGYKRPNLTGEDMPKVEVPETPAPPIGTPVVANVEETKPTKETIDFSGKNFEDTQKYLNVRAKADMMRKQAETVEIERANLMNGQFRRPSDENKVGEAIGEDTRMTPDEVVQVHLDKFKTAKELESYLRGNVKDQKVADRINSFFEDEENGEVLQVNRGGTTIKTEADELEFKRSLLVYFKQNDEYLAGIDEELKKMDDAVAEFNSEISTALNPLKDNILAYADYLEQQGQETGEENGYMEKRRKEAMRKKAKAIRSGYTLQNLMELVENRPSIIGNAVKDFHSNERIKDIGARYGSKLKTAGVDFNLFNLIADDVKDSLEYRILAPDDYPEGFENFTVFFIIRSLSMSLPDEMEQAFHASVRVAFTQLLEGTMDPDVAETMKEAIKKFLSYFA